LTEVFVSELLKQTSDGLVIVFVVTSMASMGLTLKLQEIISPLRRPLLVLATLIGNFVLVPFITYLLTAGTPLSESHETGLLILAAASGAPFLPKLVELARGDVGLSVSVMLLQTVGTIVFVPLALPWLIPGLQANAWAIAKPLLLLMLLPLALCMLIHRYLAALAGLLRPVLAITSNIALLLAVLLLLGLNMPSFLATLGSGAALTGASFVLLACAVGYLLGRLQKGTVIVQTLGTGQRNIAAALVVATSNKLDAAVIVILLLTTFVGLAVLLAAAFWFRRTATIPSAQGTHERKERTP
jgi:BASS family bile acid:Na+ symporter